MQSLIVKIGSVVDTQSGRVYPSRSDCIEALGKGVIPLLRDKRYKRLRVITVQDRLNHLYEEGKQECIMASILLEGSVRAMGEVASGDYSQEDFESIVGILEALREDLVGIIGTIKEASGSLEAELIEETMRNEFRIDIGSDIKSMVYRL